MLRSAAQKLTGLPTLFPPSDSAASNHIFTKLMSQINSEAQDNQEIKRELIRSLYSNRELLRLKAVNKRSAKANLKQDLVSTVELKF
jgi:hypothetical protein